MKAIPRTYAEVDGLITMLQVACEDATINQTRQELLSQPDENRRGCVLDLATMLRSNAAPAELIEAIVCLLDDVVAEKAYEAIFKCARKAKSRRLTRCGRVRPEAVLRLDLPIDSRHDPP